MNRQPTDPSPAGRFFYLLVICMVAALGGLLFGFDTAVVSGAQRLFKAEFQLNAFMEGWVTSSALVGCFFGALAAGTLSDRFGRKKVMVLAAVFFLVSAVWCGFAGGPGELVAARLIGGLGIGIASLISPLYIAEISPPRIRGFLVALQQLAIVLGILGSFYCNSAVLHTELAEAAKWRLMFGLGALPALLFLVCILPVPESPRWLIQRGREAEALGILTRVAGAAEAGSEAGRIREVIAGEGGRWGDLFKPGLRRAVAVGVGLMILTQVTGINAIMYYAPKVFEQAGVSAAVAYNNTVWVGLVNLVFTLVSMAVVDRLGRKPLLLIGAVSMGAALFGVGWAFHAQLSGMGVLAGVLVYVGSFAVSMGVVGWVLVSEIYPTRVRGRAMSLATGAVWGACFLVSQTFPMLIERCGAAWTFWIYGLMCAVAFVFVAALVPETKGRSLEEIEQSWTRR